MSAAGSRSEKDPPPTEAPPVSVKAMKFVELRVEGVQPEQHAFIVDGFGRLDWPLVEETFKAESVDMLVDGKPVSVNLYEGGSLHGLTRRAFEPGETYTVVAKKKGESDHRTSSMADEFTRLPRYKQIAWLGAAGGLLVYGMVRWRRAHLLALALAEKDPVKAERLRLWSYATEDDVKRARYYISNRVPWWNR